MEFRRREAADQPLEIGSDTLRLQLLADGARVHRLLLPTGGGWRNVVLGHPEAGDYRHDPGHFFGATIGRYANRIGGAQFSLDGRRYLLQANDRDANLHGGPGGWHARVWEVAEHTRDSVRFTLISPDGEEGFPGTVRAQARYRVGDRDGRPVVQIDYRASTDRPTVLAMTNHTYFNLAGADAGTIDEHTLSVEADHYLPVDASSIPTGEIAPVSGTPFDLREDTRLGPAIRTAHPQLIAARGIDHTLVLRRSAGNLRPVARLTAPGQGLAMQLETDQPGLQVYTGNFLTGATVGAHGRLYRQGDGLALEPQVFPDTPNRPEFGSATLLPGQTYRCRIAWVFSLG